MYCLKHCHVQKNPKRYHTLGLGKSLQGPKIQINQKIHQTWDVFRWMNRDKCWEMQSLASVFGWEIPPGEFDRIFSRIFSREIPENPNLNHPFSTVYWEKPSQAYLRRRRCVPSLCIGDVMVLQQAGISGRKRDVLLMLPGTKAGELVGYVVEVTPLKTNMSPENRWLEDVFPTEMVTL